MESLGPPISHGFGLMEQDVFDEEGGRPGGHGGRGEVEVHLVPFAQLCSWWTDRGAHSPRSSRKGAIRLLLCRPWMSRARSAPRSSRSFGGQGRGGEREAHVPLRAASRGASPTSQWRISRAGGRLAWALSRPPEWQVTGLLSVVLKERISGGDWKRRTLESGRVGWGGDHGAG